MRDMDPEILNAYAFVISSDYRVRVVNTLKGCPFSTPSEICRNSGIIQNHMSNVLNGLKDFGVIECLNEEARKGRLYRLTDLGNIVADNIPEE